MHFANDSDTDKNWPEAEALMLLRAPLLRLPQIAKDFEHAFHHVAQHSSAEFLSTPVTALPSGRECGKFLAMDLGGSNLRVAVVELDGATETKVHVVVQGNWEVPARLKRGAAEELFAWVAERIADILSDCVSLLNAADREILFERGVELGVCFSFPMEQSSHTSALLMPMGKGFTFRTTNNLTALLEAGYSQLPSLPPLRIVSITNDSVATLLSAAYFHPTLAAAGIIAGTGTNSACLCPPCKLSASKQPSSPSHKSILINTEWSINGTLPPLAKFRTPWDLALDVANEKPGFQPLEEMLGGRYLGEIVRLVLCTLFSDLCEVPEWLTTPYALSTKLCSEIEGATSDEAARELLAPDLDFWLLPRARTFRAVAEAVSTRAAGLLAAATVGVLAVNDELRRERIVVGCTGTVLERYYGFRERCQRFLDTLVGEGKVRLVEVRDGGIVGAAVLAAMVKNGIT
ncbi:hypothetical protein FN846DRAFT_514530 [Sphaerosporella brunnea]|uniref:Phosphotransferase n=1 Tax=Sphaerosporella brunnea TaxID=1250544 RepID=A0A5J5EDC1_9PEZI|nr:hypothetical protein FN846DRAFT_514530 [Sphaerosporella brunnea]